MFSLCNMPNAFTSHSQRRGLHFCNFPLSNTSKSSFMIPFEYSFFMVWELDISESRAAVR